MINIKALYTFIEENFKDIINVEDIFYVNRSKMPNLEILKSDNNNISIDNLYLEMRNSRKKAQILLNLYHCPKEYEKCKLLGNDVLVKNGNDNNFFNERVPLVNTINIVEAIGEFVKYHYLIAERESKIELEKNKEITDKLIGSICCYCDMKFDRNKKYCTVCEAGDDELTKYAANHFETLMMKNSNRSKSIPAIYQEVDKIPRMNNLSENISSMGSGKGHDIICLGAEKCKCENLKKSAQTFSKHLNEMKDPYITERKEISTANVTKKEEITAKIDRDSNEWKCNKCGLINREDFCMACLNEKVIFSEKCDQKYELNNNKATNSTITVLYPSTDSDFGSKNTSSIESGNCTGCLNGINCNCNTVNNKEKINYLTETNKIKTIKKISNEKYENYEKNMSKINKDSEQWNCDKCGLLNHEDFCTACLNARSVIKLCRCENCKEPKKLRDENCVSCRKSNENIRKCKNCKTINITKDRDYCDFCFNTTQQWICWNKTCNQINDQINQDYCAFCKYQKYKKDCFTIKGATGQFWQCKKCNGINDFEKKNCKSFSCKQKFEITPHKCEKCRKMYRENNCAFCETKCPLCTVDKCKVCSKQQTSKSSLRISDKIKFF